MLYFTATLLNYQIRYILSVTLLDDAINLDKYVNNKHLIREDVVLGYEDVLDMDERSSIQQDMCTTRCRFKHLVQGEYVPY